jgi:hypothetical protein
MRGGPPAAAILVLASLTLAGCAVPGFLGAEENEDGPLAVGATWTLKGSTHGYSYEEKAVVTDVVDRQGERAYQVESRFEIGDSGVKHFTVSWLRVADLATVESQTSRFGQLDNGISVDDRSRRLYDTPCPDPFDRPLAVGDSWVAGCAVSTDHREWSSSRGYSSSTYENNRTGTYRVEAAEEITVAAGTFMAYRIARTSPGEEDVERHLQWVSAEVCGPGRHPTIKMESVDHDGHESMVGLAHHDCNASASAPWGDDGPRFWSPPIVQGPPQGWPEAFAPTLQEFGGGVVLTPAHRTGDVAANPYTQPGPDDPYDDSLPLESYHVRYEVEGNPSDVIRVTASRFDNASYAEQWSQYPIHDPHYECNESPKVLLVVGVVVIQMRGDYEPHDGRDTTAILSQALTNATKALEDRFDVQAEVCDWNPRPETWPTPTSTTSGTTGP